MKKHKVNFLPAGISVDVTETSTISEAAEKAGIKLKQGCFGKHLCGLCKVKILKNPPEPTEADISKLESEEISEGFRLACRTKVKGDIEVEIPDFFDDLCIVEKKPFIFDEFSFDPYVYAIPLTLNPPSLSDNIGDLDRIIKHLESEKELKRIQIKPDFIPRLSQTLRSSNWNVSSALYDTPILQNQTSLIDIVDLTTEKVPGLFGIALDIGTSTISAYLVDLNSGRWLHSASLPNPQGNFGADVISRLQFCKNKGDHGVAQLQKAVIEGCRKLIDQLCIKNHIQLNSIYIISVVGNTVMQHLMLGLNPISLAEAPYSSVCTKYPVVDACSTGLLNTSECSHFIPLINLPGVSGYFGSDAVSDALAVISSNDYREIQSEASIICIDIGTNGEIILIQPGGKIAGCSTAAGPAFEGGFIKCGMPATAGAISNIHFEKDSFIFDVFGENGIYQYTPVDKKKNCPLGITGAALIDLIAILIKEQTIDPTGRLTNTGKLGNRVRKNSSGISEFVLLDADELNCADTNSFGFELVLTQEDIRQVQLAKGAICAGVKVLIEKHGIEQHTIKKVVLAGAFGSHINPSNIITIGLTPELPDSEIVSVGNAAGAGAIIATISKEKLAEFYKLSEKVEYVELSQDENFKEHFISSMNFPE